MAKAYVGLIDQPQLNETGPEMQAPQSINDKHGQKYANDVSISCWLRNGDATSKPSFDKGNAWRKGKGL